MVAILAGVAFAAWLAWLMIKRVDFGPGIQLPDYEPEFYSYKYSGPAKCPHCGKAITVDDVGDMLPPGNTQ